MNTQSFPNWQELARRAIERIQQPVVVDGVTFYIASEAAYRTGYSAERLRALCQNVKGNGVVLTTPNGVRFIRLPRHDGDQRAPIYIDVTSVNQKAGAVNARLSDTER